MGAWADATVSTTIVKGRARAYLTDALVNQIIPDSISDERVAAAKLGAEDRLFGSKAGRLADFTAAVGVDGVMNALASNAQTSERLAHLVALCYLYNIGLERRTSADSKLSDFADRLELEMERTVLFLERTAPAALGYTQTSGGDGTSYGGSMAKIYG